LLKYIGNLAGRVA